MSSFEQFQNIPPQLSPSIEKVTTSLGFVETSEMTRIRNEMGSTDFETFKNLFAQYEDEAIKDIETIQDQAEYMKAQINLIMAKSLMLLGRGMKEESLEQLADAHTYVSQIHDKAFQTSFNALESKWKGLNP